MGNVPNTNRRFLDAYSGANGIKTGYTRAAGFNLTASAQRGSKHIIATMFGGSSTAARNARVAELLDMGFSRAKSRVAVRAPATPAYQGRDMLVASPRNGDDDPNAGAKTIRIVTAVRTSLRPRARPAPQLSEDMLVAVAEGVDVSISETAAELSLAELAPEALDVSPPPAPGSRRRRCRDLPKRWIPPLQKPRVSHWPPLKIWPRYPQMPISKRWMPQRPTKTRLTRSRMRRTRQKSRK